MDPKEDIRLKIAKGWRNFWAVNNRLAGVRMPQRDKARVVILVVRGALTFGVENGCLLTALTITVSIFVFAVC